MNVYQDYKDACESCEDMIPVLLVKDTDNTHRRTIRRYDARQILPDGMVCIEVPSKTGDERLKDLLYFAKDERVAIDAFRRKTGFIKCYNRERSKGSNIELLCIDAEGVMHNSNYVPMFKVYCYNEANMKKIVDFANSCIKKIDRAVVLGELNENGVALIFAELRDFTVTIADQESIRKKMLNTVYKEVSSEYRTIRLDDRGGTDKSNIAKYITQKTDRLYVAKKSDAQSKF